MAEYIEREAVKAAVRKRLNNSLIIGWLISIVNEVPAADVAPVVHGRWIDRSDKGVISMTHPYVCNRCGRVEMLKEPYCNCGARMDGE